ncbi:MAG: C39 family peptidase [Lachnospiraceae bacterium]|nr:C39 family peptidase [Agathobacter sp.]MDD6445853.1 C39 family peptidase [Lachnospiraceae bacterium]MDY4893252.1 C39 family peptidase [Agathobacter sp.]
MKLIKVPYIDQSVKYPTGCESVSSVMLLRYLGYNLSVDEFIEKYLDCRDMEVRNGILYGPDPNVSFCGSPYREESFGCYAPVIQGALERAAGEKYRFINETGTSIEDLLTNYIDKNMPVVFWACINMQKEIPGPEWKLLDTGELFSWVSNEHCMLLVGYDEKNYYFNDPYDNNGVIGYPRELTEKRHAAQYQMAVGCVPLAN